MSLDVIITAIVGLVTSAVSGWVSYFFTRKKYNAEVDNDIIQNMKNTLDFYIKLSDDNRERLEKMLIRNEELEKEIAALRKQVELLTSGHSKKAKV